MTYSNQAQVQAVLAQAITSSNPANMATKGKLATLGTVVSSNTFPPVEFNYFLQQADAVINAALSQQYVVPLIETCDLQMKLTSSVDEYSSSIIVDYISNLGIGDTVIITDGNHEERLTVTNVQDQSTFNVDSMPNNSYSVGTRVLRIKFPDPIPFIATRIAAAAIYDKYLKAQTDPGKSDYGDVMRKAAVTDLNNIREGRTILDATRVGWRFANPNMISRYAMKAAIEQDNTISEPNQ